MKRWAVVTTSFEGFHRYPNAPDQVSFLRHRHRHVFHVTVWVEQFHTDRDIEYLTLKSWLNETLSRTHWPESASCEFMAETLGREIVMWNESYDASNKRDVKVQVMEDGENGALVEM